jgi:DNA gyrase/topoisomerase IV subunit A
MNNNNNSHINDSPMGRNMPNPFRIRSAMSQKSSLDKEKLYEENLQLKNEINKLKNLLSNTKKENYIFEQELRKKDKALEDMAMDAQQSMINNLSHNPDYYNQSKLLNKATEVKIC